MTLSLTLFAAGLACFSLSLSSVSFNLVSKASSSCISEETSCFLAQSTHRVKITDAYFSTYFRSTDWTRPSRFLSMEKASLRSAEKAREIELGLSNQ